MTVDDDALAAAERELSLLLRRARARTAELSREVHPDLDGSAYALLSAVVQAGGVRAQDVAAQFGVDKGAISRQIQRLEQLGLVERRPDPADGRARVLVPTPEGSARLEAATSRRRTHFRARLQDWEPGEVAQLAALLGRLNGSLDPRPDRCEEPEQRVGREEEGPE
ncbi:MAG: MarR family transcriptional regulator [Frankiales bacterium]|nr:MarR family transcriptional regulator [Frankiales bacterium]